MRLHRSLVIWGIKKRFRGNFLICGVQCRVRTVIISEPPGYQKQMTSEKRRQPGRKQHPLLWTPHRATGEMSVAEFPPLATSICSLTLSVREIVPSLRFLWLFSQVSHHNGVSELTWVNLTSANGDRRDTMWNIDNAQQRSSLVNISFFLTWRRMEVFSYKAHFLLVEWFIFVDFYAHVYPFGGKRQPRTSTDISNLSLLIYMWSVQ